MIMRGGSSKTFLHVFACMHEYLGMYVWSASHPSLNQFVQHAKPATNFNIYVQKSFKSKSIDQANSIPRASQIGDQRLRHVARRVALTTEIMNSAGRSRSTIGRSRFPWCSCTPHCILIMFSQQNIFVDHFGLDPGSGLGTTKCEKLFVD